MEKKERACKYCGLKHIKGQIWWDELVCYECREKDQPVPTYNSGSMPETRYQDDESYQFIRND